MKSLKSQYINYTHSFQSSNERQYNLNVAGASLTLSELMLQYIDNMVTEYIDNDTQHIEEYFMVKLNELNSYLSINYNSRNTVDDIIFNTNKILKSHGFKINDVVFSTNSYIVFYFGTRYPAVDAFWYGFKKGFIETLTDCYYLITFRWNKLKL